MSLTKFAELDHDTQTRIDAACSYVNHKVAALRTRFWIVLGWAAVAGIVLWEITKVVQIAIMVVMVAGIITFSYVRKQIKKLYKTVVVPRVVEALGNGLSYSAESSFSKDDFCAMDLYSGRVDRFASEDQVAGSMQNVAYTLREAHAERKEQQGKNSHYVTVFKGIVITVEFNKNFNGCTVVVPDSEGKHLGLFGQMDSRDGKQRVNMADAEFEKTYTCFSTNDQEANYILTPKLMQLIVTARSKLGAELRMSFMNNMLYVSVPGTRDHFEVSMFAKQVTPEMAMGDLADVVHLAEHLIETLDLETRIWTRV